MPQRALRYCELYQEFTFEVLADAEALRGELGLNFAKGSLWLPHLEVKGVLIVTGSLEVTGRSSTRTTRCRRWWCWGRRRVARRC
jgi:hypothetical protein